MIVALAAVLVLIATPTLLCSACGGPQGGSAITLPSADGPSAQTGANTPDGTEPEDTAAGDQADDVAVRALLEKGQLIRNLCYTARFDSSENEFIYEYYKRGDLTKEVVRHGENQSVSICDGNSTIYFNQPENIGYTITEAGGDMALVPSIDALLQETVYRFRILGEEECAGYLCQVVGTEDETGALKIWISKTLGLPLKYIGTDDNGWYSQELTEIGLDEPQASIFAVPSEVQIQY